MKLKKSVKPAPPPPTPIVGQREVMLTTDDLAARWCVSRGTLENWRWAGTGPTYIKLGGSKKSMILYRLSDILEFEREHTYKRVE